MNSVIKLLRASKTKNFYCIKGLESDKSPFYTITHLNKEYKVTQKEIDEEEWSLLKSTIDNFNKKTRTECRKLANNIANEHSLDLQSITQTVELDLKLEKQSKINRKRRHYEVDNIDEVIEESQVGKIKLHYDGASSFLKYNNEKYSIFIPEIDSVSITFSENLNTLIQAAIYLDKENNKLVKPVTSSIFIKLKHQKYLHSKQYNPVIDYMDDSWEEMLKSINNEKHWLNIEHRRELLKTVNDLWTSLIDKQKLSERESESIIENIKLIKDFDWSNKLKAKSYFMTTFPTSNK